MRLAVHWARILVIGGITSYRALFEWLSPQILVPAFVVTPLAQILFFAYIGRSARAGSDEFFLIGNALQYSVIPCLFGMTNIIAGDRVQNTLGIVLASPAPRLALVLGRALPVLVNGFAVSLFAFGAGSAMLGLSVHPATLAPLALTILVTSLSCTGLGLVNAAFGLRFLDTSVLSNLLFGLLLLFCGAEIPPRALPGWMAAAGQWLPLTHGIGAARALARGAGLAAAGGALTTELLLGLGYGACGVLLLRLFEVRSRRAAALELS